MIDEGIVRGGIAVVSLSMFIGICWWAYRPKSRGRFEADALLVFDEDEGIARATRGGGGPEAGSHRGHEGRGAAA